MDFTERFSTALLSHNFSSTPLQNGHPYQKISIGSELTIQLIRFNSYETSEKPRITRENRPWCYREHGYFPQTEGFSEAS